MDTSKPVYTLFADLHNHYVKTRQFKPVMNEWAPTANCLRELILTKVFVRGSDTIAYFIEQIPHIKAHYPCNSSTANPKNKYFHALCDDVLALSSEVGPSTPSSPHQPHPPQPLPTLLSPDVNTMTVRQALHIQCFSNALYAAREIFEEAFEDALWSDKFTEDRYSEKIKALTQSVTNNIDVKNLETTVKVYHELKQRVDVMHNILEAYRGLLHDVSL